MKFLLMPISVTFFSSLCGTISGFGISTIMIPFLINSYPLLQVFLFTAVIHLANDIWKLFLFRSAIRWHIVFYFGAASFLAALVGVLINIHVGALVWFLQVFGIFLVGYAMFLFVWPKFSFRETPASLIQGGAVSGFLHGLFGMGGVLRSAVLISFNMDKTIYLATVSAISLVVDVTRIIAYQMGGVILGELLLYNLVVCVPISLVGAKIGEKLVRYVSQQQFRKIVVGFIVLVGVKLLLKI